MLDCVSNWNDLQKMFFVSISLNSANPGGGAVRGLSACGRSAADICALQVDCSLIGWCVSSWPLIGQCPMLRAAVQASHPQCGPCSALARDLRDLMRRERELRLDTEKTRGSSVWPHDGSTRSLLVTSQWEIISAEIPTMLDHCKMILNVDIVSSCHLQKDFRNLGLKFLGSPPQLCGQGTLPLSALAINFYWVKIPSQS